MAKSDQIYVMRPLATIDGVYQHHGIDYGDGTVIHYRKTSDEAVIARTSFEAFSWGKPVHPVYHSMFDPAEVVIERAESRLGERQYDLLFNNCEHFATWCKTGRRESAQLANFGLRLDPLNLPELRDFAGRPSPTQSPDEAIRSFHQAMGNIAVAYQSILTEQQAAQQDIETWQKVAQQALQQHREDLARAALHRKITAKQRVETLTQQLGDLIDLELSLHRNRAIAERRTSLS